jgi:hypothetical protein
MEAGLELDVWRPTSAGLGQAQRARQTELSNGTSTTSTNTAGHRQSLRAWVNWVASEDNNSQMRQGTGDQTQLKGVEYGLVDQKMS